MTKQLFRVTVDGVKHELMVEPDEKLIDVLRDLGYTSVKEGCGSGECGACTVLLGSKSVLSCIMFALQVNEREVTILEGLNEEEVNPLVEVFMRRGVIQCGFCIPGIIISAIDLPRRKDGLSRSYVREALSGNLCRCTGYKKILRRLKKHLGG